MMRKPVLPVLATGIALLAAWAPCLAEPPPSPRGPIRVAPRQGEARGLFFELLLALDEAVLVKKGGPTELQSNDPEVRKTRSIAAARNWLDSKGLSSMVKVVRPQTAAELAAVDNALREAMGRGALRPRPFNVQLLATVREDLRPKSGTIRDADGKDREITFDDATSVWARNVGFAGRSSEPILLPIGTDRAEVTLTYASPSPNAPPSVTVNVAEGTLKLDPALSVPYVVVELFVPPDQSMDRLLTILFEEPTASGRKGKEGPEETWIATLVKLSAIGDLRYERFGAAFETGIFAKLSMTIDTTLRGTPRVELLYPHAPGYIRPPAVWRQMPPETVTRNGDKVTFATQVELIQSQEPGEIKLPAAAGEREGASPFTLRNSQGEFRTALVRVTFPEAEGGPNVREFTVGLGGGSPQRENPR